MIRIDNAPCSPFSVSPRLMRASMALARHYGVGNHTHLAESPDGRRVHAETYGKRSVYVAEDWGWVGAMCGTPMGWCWTTMKSS